GTAGASAGAQVVVTSTTPSGQPVNVAVYKPDGTVLIPSNSYYGGYALQTPSLPTTGTYTIFIEPLNGATANLTATLVTGDAGGGAVAVDGASQNVSAST